MIYKHTETLLSKSLEFYVNCTKLQRQTPVMSDLMTCHLLSRTIHKRRRDVILILVFFFRFCSCTEIPKSIEIRHLLVVITENNHNRIKG